MTDYRIRVEEAISSGKLWRAKEILQGRVSNSGYDAELFRLYGSVLKQMGDLRTAGRYLFLSGSNIPDHDECINIFRDRDCNRSFSDFWKTMPKTVKKLPKDEIPDNIFEEIVQLGFSRSEVDAVFGGIEKQLAEERKREKANASGKSDWVGICFGAVFVLLLIGLLYQAIAGLVAIGRLVLGWMGA